jgi:hypothetical protein
VTTANDTQDKPVETIFDMFHVIKGEAIERMEACQENIKKIEEKMHEALDEGNSENFEVHKLSKESALRTLDSHKTLVLELTEAIGKKQGQRPLPSIKTVSPGNPNDIEVTLDAKSKDDKKVEITIKCDMHGLLRNRPFYGLEKTKPEIKDEVDLDLLQAATGFVLRNYVTKHSANDLNKKKLKDVFDGQDVTRSGNKSICSIEKSGKEVVVSFAGESKESSVTLKKDATVITDRDTKHVWYSEEPISTDRNNKFEHLMTLS